MLDLLFVPFVICSLVLHLFECFPLVVDRCPYFGYSVFFTFDKSSITFFLFLRLYQIDRFHTGP